MLNDGHTLMLQKESGISEDVIARRGYDTVTVKAHLKTLGFGDNQTRVPALKIPVWGVQGEIVSYQIRPNEPRIGRNGKPVKYETPAGSHMALDIPPTIRHLIPDPAIPLWITEGIKKGDALASHACCAVGLIGVWNWRGTNEHGGKTALPDWESIALNERLVYIVFDSDVMVKPPIHQALERLAEFLKNRKATVRFVYLPSNNGEKVGVDDYLVQGHSIDDLVHLATLELQSLPFESVKPPSPYEATKRGFVWNKETKDGPITSPLTNFTAQIKADIAEDDGADTKRFFELEAQLGEQTFTFKIPVNQFVGMNWAIEHLGATALVYPGMGIRDHARAAVQMHSTKIDRRTIYTHTGWRKVNDEWVFLHADGAIGPHGLHSEIEVSLPTPLAGYALPNPPNDDQRRSAIQASLRLLEIAPHPISYSLLGGTYRVVLGNTDFSFHQSGPTGVGKTELAALYQQHFGPGLDARHLPASWSSTGNSLEGLAFVAKDVLLTVDDFAPAGSTTDIQRYHREADRLLRAQGNRAGRQRMRADASLRGAKFPRGAILSTGEDVPRGQSLRARVLFLEVGPGDVNFQKLSQCQTDAAQGLYAQSMAAFIHWLAPQYEQILGRLKTETAELRDQVMRKFSHKRTSGIVADLCLGLRYFLTFAKDVGAISAIQADAIFDQGRTAIIQAASDQVLLQTASEPTKRYIDLLNAALGAGKAHIASLSGEEPVRKESEEEWHSSSAFGWRLTTVGSGENVREEWRPQGDRIGWVEHGHLYLDPEASYGAAQKMGQTNGDALPVTALILRKRLKEKGLLITEPSRHPHLTVRKMIEGRRRDVLCLQLASLGPPKVDHVDLRPEPPAVDTSSPELWSTSIKSNGQQNDQENSHENIDFQANGPLGPPWRDSKADNSHEHVDVKNSNELLLEKMDQPVDQQEVSGKVIDLDT